MAGGRFERVEAAARADQKNDVIDAAHGAAGRRAPTHAAGVLVG
jgi:hypothetical protein